MNGSNLLLSLFTITFIDYISAIPQDVTSTNEPTTANYHEHATATAPSAAIPTVQTDGFTDENINAKHSSQSWLQQNDRYIFIIVLVLLVVAVLIYYIVKSIKGMRRRLANENHDQMIMMQNKNTIPASGQYYQQQSSSPPPPPQQPGLYSPSPLTETVSIADVNTTNGAYKLPDNYQYYHQQQQQPSPTSPPPSYHTHRY